MSAKDIKFSVEARAKMLARKGQTADRSTAGRCIWLGREIEASEFGLDELEVGNDPEPTKRDNHCTVTSCY